MLDGLRGEDSIAELCRREGINQNLYYRWSKEFLGAGKKRLADDTAREATSEEASAAPAVPTRGRRGAGGRDRGKRRRLSAAYCQENTAGIDPRRFLSPPLLAQVRPREPRGPEIRTTASTARRSPA